MKRQLKRIENAMTILTEEERTIMQIVHIEHRKYYVLQDKLNLSYQRVKQIEKQAAQKMEEYIFGKEELHG
jgi:DNA-directed RNA polymerase specialized sigma subunit